VGQQLLEAVGVPSRAELPQHVRQVRQWRDSVLRAGPHQTVELGGTPRRIVRAGEQVVAPAESDAAQLLLGDGMPRARLCRVGGPDRLFLTDRGWVSLDDAA